MKNLSVLNSRSLFILFLLFFIPFFVIGAWAILGGETVEWTQNGFLAKVFWIYAQKSVPFAPPKWGFLLKVLARSRKKGDVKSCTGALVSASLVLTSGHCVVDRRNRNETGKRRMVDFIVILPSLLPSNQSGRGQQKDGWEEGVFRSTAKLLATGGREWDDAGGWALLRIVPRNTTNTHCSPNRVSRLSFLPPNVTSVELTSPKAECHLTGFSSSEKAEDFLKEEKVFHLHLQEVAEPPMDDPFHHYRSRVHKSKSTACYVVFAQGMPDDVGAPLFCKLASSDKEDQLGIFQSLTVPLDDTMVKGTTMAGTQQCRKAREMRFTLLAGDQTLAEAIQRYAMVDEGYQSCE